MRSIQRAPLAVVLLISGCTGVISGQTGSNESPTASRASTASAGQAGAGQSGSTRAAEGGSAAIPGVPDPGRVTIRRLNRAEYDNTVRDLLGTSKTFGASTFPNDAPQTGFDNNGDLQTISPVQFSLYQQAAEALAAEALTAGSAQRARLITCDSTSQPTCNSTLLKNLGLRAFRRPLAAAEVDAYLGLMTNAAQAGATSDEQFRTVIEAMLVSPNFLFRPELDPNPTSLTPHLLSSYEIASRLSYMLYRSMPDQPLFDAAAAGALSQPAQIQAQVQRMLGDPKGTFGPTFSSQWLGTTSVLSQTFDATLFPAFNAGLASSMSQELNAFFDEFIVQNEPVQQLLSANFSYLDDNLAKLYGVPATGALKRTVFNNAQRGGLLTMAAILSETSYPTRSSVVKRGAWVLSQLLCAPPPAPPPNVPSFPDGPITGTTQEEILAAHRANPACSTCHDSIDNIGIAMENYDAIGAYRTTENGQPINANGKFAGAFALPPSGVAATFVGAQALAQTVATDPRFVSCVAKNVMSYALGRQFDDSPAAVSDEPYLANVLQGVQGAALGLRDLLMNVVASDPFRMRRGDPSMATGADQ